jgi:hypothetical protein
MPASVRGPHHAGNRKRWVVVASKVDSATWEAGDGVFLETTAAAERVFGLPETIEFIDGICQDKTLLSSTYVWGEFRRTFS